MGFAEDERHRLLAVAGVGPGVIARLEQMGYSNLQQLAGAEVGDVLAAAAQLTGSTCWRNSPQARAAITSAITMARSQR